MAIVIISNGKQVEPWAKAIQERRPEIEVFTYPEVPSPEAVRLALVWNHKEGVLKEFPNLQCIASMGAGVDHILKDKQLPDDTPITRVTDENLTKDMGAFTLALVMNHIRGLSSYKLAELDCAWKPNKYGRPSDVRVGIMGLGILGAHAATVLRDAGFHVQGWARTQKDLEGIQVYSGKDQLDEFLSKSDVLICLLPLTPETKHILGEKTFRVLPKEAFVINVARGEHLIEEELIAMIDNGHLSGASLDVFNIEPLPKDHPFWAHPKINITPHVASVTDPATAVAQILDNYDRLLLQEPLINTVSREKGY